MALQVGIASDLFARTLLSQEATINRKGVPGNHSGSRRRKKQNGCRHFRDLRPPTVGQV